MKKIIIGIVLFILVAIIAAISFVYIIRFDGAPDKSRIPKLFSESVLELYAYEIWNGKGYMLFSKTSRFGDENKIYFDRVTKAGLNAGWAWTGLQGSVPVTKNPASLGTNHCTGYQDEPPKCKTIDVFGQVNDKNIAYLEVRYNDEWHKYPVANPGYAIRIQGFNGVLSDYRWLSKDGTIIWDKQRTISSPTSL